MLKRYGHVMVTAMGIADLATLALAWIAAYFLRFEAGLVEYHEAVPYGEFVALLPYVAGAHLAAYLGVGLYQPKRRQAVWLELGELLRAVAVGWVLMVGLIYFVREQRLSRGTMVVFGVVNLAGLAAARVAVRTLLHALRRHGYNLRYVAIVGAGPLGQALLARIRSNPWTGLVPKFFIDDRPELAGREVARLPVRGNSAELVHLLETEPVDEVYVCLPQTDWERMGDLIDTLSRTTATVRIVPDLAGFLMFHTSTSTFDGLPVISLQDSPLYGWGGLVKQVFDRVGALALLLLFGPLMLLIAAAVKLTSRGPVFYRQVRVGLDGRPFQMLKFRTMKVDAEDHTGPVWAKKDDDRRTWLGTLLRRTSLDELPQFFNVLMGDMSLVGPRPERPVFIRKFREELAPYMIRHKVKPGITGWAQINGYRGDTSIRKRLQYDLYYIRNWSFLFDIRILFETLFKGFVNKNAY
jgi:Undecaprenyl-phosphate glucose phosphotransferase